MSKNKDPNFWVKEGTANKRQKGVWEVCTHTLKKFYLDDLTVHDNGTKVVHRDNFDIVLIREQNKVLIHLHSSFTLELFPLKNTEWWELKNHVYEKLLDKKHISEEELDSYFEKYLV